MSADMDALRRRRDSAWRDKDVWNGIYADAWKWLMPYRRPVNGPQGEDRGNDRVSHIFDNTGVVSTFRGAGQMHQDLFPPGQPFFRLKPGPVTKAVLKAQARAQAMNDPQTAGAPDAGGDIERQLDDVTEQIQPFFLTGEWDNAVAEMAIDLYVGTGILLMIEGDRSNPIRFVCLPVDECALEPGPYGDVGALYWRTKMTRRAILAAFPKGKFPPEFLDAADEERGRPNEEVERFQDFVQEDATAKGKTYRWKMMVSVKGSADPVVIHRYRTQPFAAPRYFRVPGETHGRGPALLAARIQTTSPPRAGPCARGPMTGPRPIPICPP